MEPINPIQAQRVWQRVRGPESDQDTLTRLLALEAESRHTYQYLQKNTHLRDSRLLARLSEESRRFFHILSGLAMIRDKDVTVTAPPSVRGNAEGLLRQSCRTRLQSLSLLEALGPDCAPSARILKDRMENHLTTILELLGQLPRK